MTIDLDSMSREELMALKKNVDKALASFEKRQREAALAAAQKAAQEHGFSLDEILGKKSRGPDRRPEIPQSRGSDTNLDGPRSPAGMVQGRDRGRRQTQRS